MFVAAMCIGCVVLTGCTSTRSIITEYDNAGNITRMTETSESVIKTMTTATENKTVIMKTAGLDIFQ